jgi:hypothetical protein
MKGICFAFDAFGQWSEHERSLIWRRMKLGVMWRPSVVAWPKICGQPTTFPLVPFYYLLLYLNHRTLGTNWRAFGHMGWPPGHLPWLADHTLASL